MYNIILLSIYLFIRQTPSTEYYVQGSSQHRIKVKNLRSKVDSENGIKVHSTSVLYSRNTKGEDKNSGVYRNHLWSEVAIA